MAIERLCPNCGEPNDDSRSICKNCSVPLNVYGGQVGQEEQFDRKLAVQVQSLDVRPPAVWAAVVLMLLFVLLVPVSIGFNSIHNWQSTANNPNYMAHAVSVIVPIFTLAITVPVDVVVCILAWAVFSQKTAAWKPGIFALLVTVPAIWMSHGAVIAIIWSIVTITVTVMFSLRNVKAWYGF